jgi:UTP--glucose-1-phosphate uridylyltransferase
VILPDDVIAGDTPCLQQMVEGYEAAGGGCMMAVMDVPESQVSSYGVLKVAEDQGDLVRAAGLVEKPDSVAEASSDATDRSTIGRSGVPRDIGFGEHATGLGQHGGMAGRASQNANSG